MLFWCKGCCCLEEAAVASIAVFVISLDLESFVDEGSKFKNEDFDRNPKYLFNLKMKLFTIFGTYVFACEENSTRSLQKHYFYLHSTFFRDAGAEENYPTPTRVFVFGQIIIFSVTFTDPIFSTLPTSFLPRSNNIKCSAFSL